MAQAETTFPLDLIVGDVQMLKELRLNQHTTEECNWWFEAAIGLPEEVVAEFKLSDGGVLRDRVANGQA